MILLAYGEFKSNVYLIWYAQRFEGVDNLAPQENCQEGGVGSANYSRISKRNNDILANGEFLFYKRLS